MTTHKTDRREFITRSARTGIAVCGACLCSGFSVFAETDPSTAGKQPPDPKKLEYCGYTCSGNCTFFKATVSNDVELKKEAWKRWNLEERFGVAFDRDLAFCHRCKAPGKPEGFVVQHCDVRSCVLEKELECCIECDELPECDKDLWTRFPKFKEQVVAMQQLYLGQD